MILRYRSGEEIKKAIMSATTAMRPRLKLWRSPK